MALFNVRPTKLDKVVADDVSKLANPALERVAEILTWGGDEHLLCLAAGVFWLTTRGSDARQRQLANHVLGCTMLVTVLPHILKTLVDQKRPDRRTFVGHLRGIPWSGKRYDAFPSGHAVHMGMVVGIAPLWPSGIRNALWSIAAVVSATRVVLLAHWLSDVVAGLGMGLLLERLARPLTLARRGLVKPRRRSAPVENSPKPHAT
jgi:membrane-associated phospholipid phosphatase